MFPLMDTFSSHRLRAKLVHALRRFAVAEGGATAIEYGLIAALTALAAVPAMGALGGKLSSTFGAVSSAIDSDSGKPPPSSPPDADSGGN